jgi:hypothetical protein
VLIALFLIPFNAYWVVQLEVLSFAATPTALSLFWNVIFSLVVVMVLNALVRALRPRAALSQAELMTIYALLAMGTAAASAETLQHMICLLGHAFRFASPANNWETNVWPYLPRWLTVSDPDALAGYYEATRELYTWARIKVWLVPLGWWSAYILACFFVMLCINSLFRKQWTERERLSYPIIQLPLLMTEGAGRSFFRSKLLWAGFALAGGIDLLNGYAVLFPSLPSVNVKLTYLHPYLNQLPWTAMGALMISFYPFIIGMSYFLPTDVAFSCWFFYLFRKLELLICGILGWVPASPGNFLAGMQAGEAPYLSEQSWGAWMALFGIALFSARHYLREVWRVILGRPGALSDAEEPMSYRAAAIGLVLGLGFLFLFLFRAGMTPLVIALYLLMYFAFSTAIAKMRAELGPPSHEMAPLGTSKMIVTAAGTITLGMRNLTMFALLGWQNTLSRSHAMPQGLEGFRAAERTGFQSRWLVPAMLLAAALALFFGAWTQIHAANYYEPGATWAGIATGNRSFGELQHWRSYDLDPSLASLFFMGVGALATVGLTALRFRFMGLPLHPSGYALGMCFGLDYFWFPLLIAWLTKVIVLRYWGLRGYRRSLYFFLGLMLGEFMVGGAWSIYGVIKGFRAYTFWIF